MGEGTTTPVNQTLLENIGFDVGPCRQELFGRRCRGSSTTELIARQMFGTKGYTVSGPYCKDDAVPRQGNLFERCSNRIDKVHCGVSELYVTRVSWARQSKEASRKQTLIWSINRTLSSSSSAKYARRSSSRGIDSGVRRFLNLLRPISSS